MKARTLMPFVALAASLVVSPMANAAGMIMIDPVGGNVPAIAMIPPIHAPVVPVHPPVNPVHPVPPVPPSQPPPVQRPVLHGTVSIGLRLQSETVKVDVSDQVAKTYISETFVNDTDRNLAGTYLFPLPEDTTFSSFSLHIDGKPVEGKILEAQEARQEYEAIVRRMVDPGLLEYADYKTVRARIFPIPAHGSKKVELEYTQVLKAENGMLKYRFPLKTEGQSAAVSEVNLDVKLASKQGLRTIWSPTHTISTSRTDENHAKIALLLKDTVPDKDFILYYSVSDKDLSANLLTHRDNDEDGYFLLTLTPPMSSKKIISKDIVLVSDTSGSMAGEKMEQNKKALSYVVNSLNTADRFDIIQFNTDVEKFQPHLVAATMENKKAALGFINDLEARGGTNIGDALHAGISILKENSDRPTYLVMMTDGLPTVGEQNVSKLVKTVDGGRDIRLFDFGIGYDVNTKLLNKLADQHHGLAQYVEPDENIETALSSFYQKIKSPVLSNVTISYEGVQVKDVYPREVKDIFAGNQILLIGKYKSPGHATVKLTGQVNAGTKSFSFPLAFPAEETGKTYLSRLWAMRRIGYLTDVAQENGENREVIDEIVALSKKYGIISAYTSFLVTDPSENHRLGNAVMPMSNVRAQMAPSPAVVSYRGAFAGAPPAPPLMNGFVAGLSVADNRAVAQSHFYGAAGEGGGAGVAVGVRGNLSRRDDTGRLAVKSAKSLQKYKDSDVLADEKAEESAGVKSIEDKTFYLSNGFWVDSTYDPSKSPKPQTVKFGSDKYFNLLHSTPGLSKYLSVGQQVILIFKGHCYKITAEGATTT